MDGVPLNLAVDCRVYKQCRQVVSGEEQESLQLLPVHQPQLNDRRQRRDVRAQERHRSKDGRQSWSEERQQDREALSIAIGQQGSRVEEKQDRNFTSEPCLQNSPTLISVIICFFISYTCGQKLKFSQQKEKI